MSHENIGLLALRTFIVVEVNRLYELDPGVHHDDVVALLRMLALAGWKKDAGELLGRLYSFEAGQL
jgi:hypothetical protein